MNPDPDRSRLIAAGAVPCRCRVCGCTEDRACVSPGGVPCSWVPGTGRTLCTACLDRDGSAHDLVVAALNRDDDRAPLAGDGGLSSVLMAVVVTFCVMVLAVAAWHVKDLL